MTCHETFTDMMLMRYFPLKSSMMALKQKKEQNRDRFFKLLQLQFKIKKKKNCRHCVGHKKNKITFMMAVHISHCRIVPEIFFLLFLKTKKNHMDEEKNLYEARSINNVQ